MKSGVRDFRFGFLPLNPLKGTLSGGLPHKSPFRGFRGRIRGCVIYANILGKGFFKIVWFVDVLVEFWILWFGVGFLRFGFLPLNPLKGTLGGGLPHKSPFRGFRASPSG
ncbi:MAG: hypothetical protein AAF570_04305 [Bacteroidota bacterium]